MGVNLELGCYIKERDPGPDTQSPRAPHKVVGFQFAAKMTVWCDFCKSHLSSPCSLHQSSEDISNGACKTSRSTRSTKGASKVRRDLLNAEIRSMRALLPLPREEQERLSYLHTMAAVCTYIRKSVVLQGLPVRQGPGSTPPYETFLPALHGFILVLGAQGKLVYVSENVAEYLGHSMVDVLQGDTVYDMIERSDVDTVMAQLESDNNSSTERSFVCSMQTTKAFRLKHGHCCSMLVRGCFQSASRSPSLPVPTESSSGGERVFVALCTPTVDRVQGPETGPLGPYFSSVHKPDLSFTHVSDSVVCYLGYTAEEMSGRSWYAGLHPQDLKRAVDAHLSLVEADEGREVEMVLRLQHKDLTWTWVYTRATNQGDSQSIHCTNHIISESEAFYLVKKIQSDTSGRSLAEAELCPPQAVDVPQPGSRRRGPARGFRRPSGSDSRGEEPAAKTRRWAEGGRGGRDVHRAACVSSSPRAGPDASTVAMGDSLLRFTPPHSPAPSVGSLGSEEPGCDFLMDLHGCSDPSASSPESSPSYYPYLDSLGPFPHTSPYGPLDTVSPRAFEGDSLGVNASPLAELHLSPRYRSGAGCAAGTRLVPDCLSLPDMLGGPEDFYTLAQADLALLELPPGGSAFQTHHVPPGLLTPSPSPTSLGSFQYDCDWEHAEISILAQQISSLANTFDLYGVPGRGQGSETEIPHWSENPSLPAAAAAAQPFKQHELVLDDSVFDSLLKELEVEDPREACTIPCAGTGTTVSQCSQPGQGEMALLHQGSPATGVGLATVADPLTLEPFSMGHASVEPWLGGPQQSPGRHQLDCYIQRNDSLPPCQHVATAIDGPGSVYVASLCEEYRY
ncbi:neuronal PAS domain-containing protein 4-like [Gadus morhua]|uniref:neuronal PAS domain-containing protein 4-like n=1 Tax=Gadus morhua TaxID=8049 RepID=UPI0011B64F38|nr:neuronal PAS domain-containing protein 4-like [Gadus morhua]